MPLARLLESTLGDPFQNVAAEEAIFVSMKEATLRIWENQRSVVIGRAQLASLETDLSLCGKRGVPIVRRLTAGGTVYNGKGNLNWSFFVPRETRLGVVQYAREPGVVFRTCGEVVADALKRVSTRVTYAPPNSLVGAGGKVSGMAAYISKDGFLCHGTLLVDADLSELEELTTPSGDEAEAKFPRSNHVAVENTHVDKDGFLAALRASIGAELKEDEFRPSERRLVQDLVEERYSTPKWNLGDPFLLDNPQGPA